MIEILNTLSTEGMFLNIKKKQHMTSPQLTYSIVKIWKLSLYVRHKTRVCKLGTFIHIVLQVLAISKEKENMAKTEGKKEYNLYFQMT